MREKDTCTNSMKINQILRIRYDCDKDEKNNCVNSSGMNATFDISHNFRINVKFSTHMMNDARVKLGFSCSSYFRPIVVQVSALTTALNNFRLHSLRNKMVTLVLTIEYHFDFRLQFDINKNAFSCNYMA